MLSVDSKPHSSANDGRTHWAECWRVHLDCAEVRIERLEEQLEAAQKNLDKQMASMSAALTREVRAREGLQEQLETQTEAFEVERTAMAAAQNSLAEQLETQVGLIRDLASELASVSDIAAAPDGDYERWLRGLLARVDAAVGEPGV